MRDFFPRFFFSLVHSTRFYAQIWKFDSSTVCVSRDSITIVDRRLKAIYIYAQLYYSTIILSTIFTRSRLFIIRKAT